MKHVIFIVFDKVGIGTVLLTTSGGKWISMGISSQSGG